MPNNKKGRLVWAPQIVITELNDIKEELKIDKDGEAFKELARAARLGREASRLAKLDLFGRLPTILPKEKKKDKKRRGLF